ncbi:MAG: polymer-forming cytoskeletal protein [Kouleothrix sp.]|jgi:cytoskeletal protein CcmA (bactofilin family)|nr:polymer-forming cytoskeletal protein [Kouleothrix sp.]
MFGRRNPDRPLDQHVPALKSDLDLDMLDDLPEIPAPAPSPAAVPAPAATAVFGTPTGLLREPEPAVVLPEPQAGTITQQLPALEFESTFAQVREQIWPAPAAVSVPTTVLGLHDLPGELPELPEIETPAMPDLALPLVAPASSGGDTEPDQSWAAPSDPSPLEAAPAPSAITAPPAALEASPPPAPEPLAPEPAAAPEPPALEPPAPEPAAALEASPPPAAPTRVRTVAESVIGPDDFFDGHYRSERGVRIQGNARGSIESRQYIHVEDSAQVEADLAAEEITIAGNFTGKITCRGRLEITSTGVVQGQIETATLVVYEGGTLEGELHMRKPA